MKRYEAYKDSGIEWIGEIPEHWEVNRLKYIAPASTSKLAEKPTGLPYLGLENIESKTGRISLDVPIENVESTVAVFEEGNILFGKLRPYLAKISLVNFRGVCTTELLALQPNDCVNGKFLYYCLLSANFIEKVNSMTYGAKMPRVSSQQVGNLSIVLPSLVEQNIIAVFLDRKLAEIDRFIANKKRLIALLQEQKTAIVNHAMTCGLDPGVPMKHSGIESLGEIPEHWQVKRARYLFREINERSETGLETHLSMSQKFGLIETNSIEEKTLQSETQEGFKRCQVNDLILNRLKAHLGIFARATIPGLVSPDYTVFRLKVDANVRYFETLFRHPAYVAAFNKAVRGIVVGFLRLYTPEFNDIRVLFPPKEEQERIVCFIQDETAKFEHIIHRANLEIELVKEYRTRLIADVVMGKLDVRDVELPSLEEGDNIVLLDDEMIDDVLKDNKELEPLEESVYADN